MKGANSLLSGVENSLVLELTVLWAWSRDWRCWCKSWRI